MFHYFGTVTNTRGDSLPGWRLEVHDGSAVVPIYSGDGVTPLPGNRSVTDAQGNADFYVADGVYNLRYYDLAGVLQRTDQSVIMRALLNYPNSPEALPLSTAQAQALAAKVDEEVFNDTVAEIATDLVAQQEALDLKSPIDTTPNASYKYPVAIPLRAVSENHVLNFIPSNLHVNIVGGANTTDLAPYIERALFSEAKIDLGGLPMLVKTPIRIASRRRIYGRGSRITAEMINAGDAVFTTHVDENGDQYGADLRLYNMEIFGAATAVRFRITTPRSIGMSIKAFEVLFDGLVRAPGTKAIDMRCADFCELRSCNIRNYDMGFSFESLAGWERDNTQNTLSVVGIENANSVGYIEDCDKFTARNVDTMFCGSGLVIGKDNLRVNLHQFHVERIGWRADWKNAADVAAGKSFPGWGLYIVDNVNNSDVTLDQCSFFHNEAEAPIGGVYRGRNTNGTRSNVRMAQCFLELPSASGPSVTWKPLEAHGQLHWVGRFPFPAGNNVVLGDSTDNNTDIIIDEDSSSARGDGNRSMLPGTKAINLRSTSGAATAITEDDGTTIIGGTPYNFLNQAHKVTFSGIGERYEVVNLKVGWYTLFLTGNVASGIVFASVRDDATQVDNFLQRQVNFQVNYEHPMRMPFFVSKNGAYRVGFRSSGGAAALLLGSMGLFRGHYIDQGVRSGAWDIPPVVSLPAPSAFYEGTSFSVADAAHVCLRASGGAYAWKQLA